MSESKVLIEGNIVYLEPGKPAQEITGPITFEMADKLVTPWRDRCSVHDYTWHGDNMGIFCVDYGDPGNSRCNIPRTLNKVATLLASSEGRSINVYGPCIVFNSQKSLTKDRIAEMIKGKTRLSKALKEHRRE